MTYPLYIGMKGSDKKIPIKNKIKKTSCLQNNDPGEGYKLLIKK